MKTILGAAAIAAAMVSWQPLAHATTTIAITENNQPLTRGACDKAGLAWDDGANVCDWQAEEPKEQRALESAPEITGSVTSGQPLTRADCDSAGLAWDDNVNVCDWRPKVQLVAEPEPEAAAAIVSAQPLTRAGCDSAGLAWNDNVNVCGWQPKAQLDSQPEPEAAAGRASAQPLTRVSCDSAGFVWNDKANVCGINPEDAMTQSSASSEIGSKPYGTAKRSTKMQGHTKRKYTYRSLQPKRNTRGSRPKIIEGFAFRLFRN